MFLCCFTTRAYRRVYYIRLSSLRYANLEAPFCSLYTTPHHPGQRGQRGQRIGLFGVIPKLFRVGGYPERTAVPNGRPFRAEGWIRRGKPDTDIKKDKARLRAELARLEQSLGVSGTVGPDRYNDELNKLVDVAKAVRSFAKSVPCRGETRAGMDARIAELRADGV